MTAIEFQGNLVSLQRNLLQYAYGLTSNKDDAEDLMQETYLKALKYRDKFALDSNLKAWLYAIMKNTFINNYRRNKRLNDFNNQKKEQYSQVSFHTTGDDDPESAYKSKELQDIIEKLDENYRIPFKMCHEGFKYKEIAESLELNIGTVKSRIFITRKKLMKQLAV